MPRIDKFNGINIYIHANEHPPPHVHAVYNEYEVAVDIAGQKIIAGYLPMKQMRQVNTWLIKNAETAIKNFDKLNLELR